MIPLSVPNISGNEWKYVKDCLDTGWISSAGDYVNKFEETIKNYTGVKHTVACMNGTVGLQVSLECYLFFLNHTRRPFGQSNRQK